MSDRVFCGYHGYYRPPYSFKSSTSGNGGSIYCITTQYDNVLVLIPLVPNFFIDVVTIIRNNPARLVYFIAPDMGPRFISDYLSSWYLIKKQMGRECKFFSYYLPEERSISQDFLDDICRSKFESHNIVLTRSVMDVGVMNFQYQRLTMDIAAPSASDLVVNTPNGSKFFAVEMNERKAQWLNEHAGMFDEIHVPYIEGSYPTMTYNELMRQFPGLVRYVLVNQFSNREELAEARARGVRIGGLIT